MPYNKIIILAHYTSLYGANLSLLTFLKNTSINSTSFILILPNEGELSLELDKLNIKYIYHWYPLNVNSSEYTLFTRFKSAIKKIRYIFQLYKLIKNLKPQLIYSNSSVLYYGFFISKLLRTPHIWHLREFGTLDYQLIPDFGTDFQKKLLSINTFNIAISQSIAQHYNLKKENSKTIYNGVVKEDELTKKFEFSDFKTDLNFGVVGVIVPYKNQLEIIKAFHLLLKSKDKSLKNCKLYLIGEGSGEYYKTILQYINSQRLEENVILTGHIKETERIYSLFDVLINGSIYEGFGRVTVEAMSYGKIPIGYNHNGNAELIENEVTGLLFNDFNALYYILLKISIDKNYLRELQIKMKNSFKKEFTIEYYCKSMDSVFSKYINPN